MSQPTPTRSNKPFAEALWAFFTATRRRMVASGVVLMAVLGLFAYWLFRPAALLTDQTSFEVRRGDLKVSVLEGGTLFSVGAKEIKNQVEGSVQIISVVPEGTVLTAADVANKRVLLELDSSSLKDKAAQQDITVQSSAASLVQAKEQYDIQVNQNESNIKAAELAVQFAMMDLEKYLGAALARDVLARKVDFMAICGGEALPEEIGAKLNQLDVGGDARQQSRKLQTDIALAGEEVKRAESTCNADKELGPVEMGGKGYIMGTEVEADALALKRQQQNSEQAQLALQIFLKYDFPKQVQTLLSNYEESGKKLQRTQATARAQLAQADADRKAKEATYKVQKDRLDKMNDQIRNCTIVAPNPGMVVYPTTAMFGPGRGSSSDKIEEGASVRQNQVLLTITNSDNMAINVKVHEASINKIQAGQQANIVVEGFPDRELKGRVKNLAMMADQQNPWQSPDLKVYNVVVVILNPPADLKPGMGAKVEIMVRTVPDVLMIPLQAVSTLKGKRICLLDDGGAGTQRVIETGDNNDNFIEVKSGLSVGDRVLLHVPIFAGAASEAEVRPESKSAEKQADDKAVPAAGNGAPANGEAKSPAANGDAAAGNGNGDGKNPPAATGETASKLIPEAEELLSRLPEEMRGTVRAQLEKLTPAEQQAKLKEMQQRRGNRQRGEGHGGQGQPPAGGPPPAGEPPQ